MLIFSHQVFAAGATKLSGNIEKCEVEDIDWAYNVTVRSRFMLTKAAAPHLEKTKGVILHVSAAAGLIPYSFNVAFSTTSIGLNQFVQITSLSLAEKGIRVNSIW